MEKVKDFLEGAWEQKRKVGMILLVFFLFELHYVYAYSEVKLEKVDTSLLDEVKIEPATEENEEKKEEKEEEKEDVVTYYYVDVKGEVKKPGVYQVEEGKRVFDVLDLAGGVLKDGDTTALNLSKKVEDEMVIYVRNKKEVESCENLSFENTTKEEQKTDQNLKISINQATLEELQMLPSIGESKAKAIVDYRNKNGSFKSLEELKLVSGIGEKLFEQIKDYITL